MSEGPTSEITQILREWTDGDEASKEHLLKFVYGELKNQARLLMSKERSNHTLQTTALVHEAFLKIGGNSGVVWKDRTHFFAVTLRLMRQVLVDHARAHAAKKRGNQHIHFSTDDIDIPVEQRADSILAIDEVLDRLAAIDGRQAQIVEMRFFGGMTNVETADALEISERTVAREWRAAKLWLYRELSSHKKN